MYSRLFILKWRRKAHYWLILRVTCCGISKGFLHCHFKNEKPPKARFFMLSNNGIIFSYFLQANSDVYEETNEDKLDPVQTNQSRVSRYLAFSGKGKKDIFPRISLRACMTLRTRTSTVQWTIFRSSCSSLRPYMNTIKQGDFRKSHLKSNS